jgi:DNA-binding response OmpR family regulator
MSKATILIVDDEADIVELTSMALNAYGYNVISACNGAEGAEKAMESMPDIILMDVMMPILDGIGATKKLKANEETKHIPILMLTAKAQESDIQQGIEAGADAYIIKPFDIAELIKKINSYLG